MTKLFSFAVCGALVLLGQMNGQAHSQTVRTKAEITLKDGAKLKVDDLRWQGYTDGVFRCSSQVKPEGLDYDIYAPYANIERIEFGNRIKHPRRDYVEVLMVYRSERRTRGYNYADNYFDINETNMPRAEAVNMERIKLVVPLTSGGQATTGEPPQDANAAGTDYTALERVLKAAQRGDTKAQDAVERLILDWKKWKGQTCSCQQSEANRVEFTKLDSPGDALPLARSYCERNYRCLLKVTGVERRGDNYWAEFYCCQ